MALFISGPFSDIGPGILARYKERLTLDMFHRLALIFVFTAVVACTSGERNHNLSGDGGIAVSDRDENDPAVARVNGIEIYKSDILRFARANGQFENGEPIGVNDPAFAQLIEELIDQRLLALDAIEIDLDKDQEARLRLQAARERILGNLRVERHLQKTVTEDAIKRLYEEQAKLAARGDELRARHILVADKSTADELLASLETGEDFASLAKANSLDRGTASRGGDLGYFTRDMLDQAITTPMFQAAKGELVGPVKSDLGWHIAEVLDRRSVPQPTFETLKPRLENFMTFDAIQDLLSDLRDTNDVEIYELKAPSQTDEKLPLATEEDPE